jgi:hypothetical protein
VSPIYVRPEREQAEHDRLIRFLQAKYSKKFEAVANPGDERVAPVKVATAVHFPDLVLNNGKALAGVVEIETAASVNNLETMAKWVPFSRARVPFHLYVPVQGYEAAMRLADAHRVKAAEIWTYRAANDGFDLVRMFVDESVQSRAPKPVAAAPKSVSAAPKSAAAAPKADKAPAPRSDKPAAPKPTAAAKTVKGKTAVPAKPARAAASRPAAKSAKVAAPAKAGKPARAAKATKAKAAPARAAKPAAKAARKANGRKGR